MKIRANVSWNHQRQKMMATAIQAVYPKLRLTRRYLFVAWLYGIEEIIARAARKVMRGTRIVISPMRPKTNDDGSWTL